MNYMIQKKKKMKNKKVIQIIWANNEWWYLNKTKSRRHSMKRTEISDEEGVRGGPWNQHFDNLDIAKK